MKSIGIQELRENTARVVRTLRRTGEEVSITIRGEVVARLMPVLPRIKKGDAAVWAEIDDLAVAIGKKWRKGKSASEVVSEGRRCL